MHILLVVPRYPWPPRRGDQLRTVQTLESLADVHPVTLLAPAPGAGDERPPRDLAERFELVTYRPPGAARQARGVLRALATGRPLQCGLYDSPDLRRRLRDRAAHVDLVVLQLVRLAGYSDALEGLPMVVDFIDSLSLNFTRRADLDPPWRRPLWRFEARRLQEAERRLFERARRTVVVSPRDRQWLADGWSLRESQRGRLPVVPLAVTGGEPKVDRGPEEDPPVLALTGNLGYWANVDAARWWLAEVWPELTRRRPEVCLVVAGARPPKRLARAVTAAGGELIASPPDLRAVLARATIALAPLRGGSGVPVKVLEAWAVGVPVVVSPWAAAGTTGKNGEDFLVAETREQWLAALLELLDDPHRRRQLRAAGRRRLATDHSFEHVRVRWRSAIALADLSPGD